LNECSACAYYKRTLRHWVHLVQLIGTFKPEETLFFLKKKKGSRLGSALACEKRDLNCVTRPRARVWQTRRAAARSGNGQGRRPQTNRQCHAYCFVLRTNGWSGQNTYTNALHHIQLHERSNRGGEQQVRSVYTVPPVASVSVWAAKCHQECR
jgi:hypothetical protein